MIKIAFSIVVRIEATDAQPLATVFVMAEPAKTSKHLFRHAPASVRKLADQAQRERRDTARREFKRTQDESANWNQQKPRL